ncbi:hypothetical protein Purlil1_13466 [Purpureocillium lilacinum]|uniref:WSC domain-containing protein n=1 Tax=Purpureocillium lilacinum TaxID=33203 RepID=A0ABR0BDX9_PURLI|nr:hypothetical protein Purlil1_13466 [Purpureocillium lilacinum]
MPARSVIMKAALVLSLSAAVAGTRLPQYEWDPATISSCVEWYNNGMDETCEYVRVLFGATPEEFTSWNPSVGLDCKPWRFQSYCVVTQEKLDASSKTKTTASPTATTITSTTTSASLGPSPSSWEALGCYAEVAAPNSVLERRMSSETGDAVLTIPRCLDLCYRAAFPFAGVENGNQCWCGSYVGGEFAQDSSDCDLACSGDAQAICGGKDRLNIFRAKGIDEHTTVSATATASSSIQASLASPLASQSTSAGKKGLRLF